MALVTVQRSPSSTTSPQTDSDIGVNVTDEINMGRNSKSLSECYFAGKGSALVLPPTTSEPQKAPPRRAAAVGSNIQKHLQSMFYLLRPEETLKMAVKLESVNPVRTRYLVVVSRLGARAEESCLLGIDCNERTTVGMVLKVLADTAITLDGDGGFSVTVCGRHHIFKPVSVQAMWSALQTLHKASSKAREHNYFQGGATHTWVHYYESRIESDRSCLNEWNAMDCLESRRAPSPDSARTKPTERSETERVIKSTLKEIMMSVDLDEVTSKYIRSRLEELFDMDLAEYKSFIDQEMLIILGQMDAPTEIFDHVYLGSEWNASNYEELQRNGVGHILNVTREIDNFFPGTFDYYNVRVYDDEKTDLLRHWDNTFKYITNAKRQGSKVLVHCKMGVSRSASVVIAYAMKACNWNFAQAMDHVKQKRNCIKPNTSFLTQLETYQGILDAMKNREKLQRSKSETNLKSPGMVTTNELVLGGSEPTPPLPLPPPPPSPPPPPPPIVSNQTTNLSKIGPAEEITMSGQDLSRLGTRPKSWSPECVASTSTSAATAAADPLRGGTFRSLENLNCRRYDTKSMQTPPRKVVKSILKDAARNVLLPCDNGESYSVSPNQIMHIPNCAQDVLLCLASVKERVNELELEASKMKEEEEVAVVEEEEKKKKKKIVLNLLSPFDQTGCKLTVVSNSPQTILEVWDPGDTGKEDDIQKVDNVEQGATHDCDFKNLRCLENTESVQDLRTDKNNVTPNEEEEVVVTRDVFSNQCDRVFDREERKQRATPTMAVSSFGEREEEEEIPRNCPSRQSSWSSYDSAVGLNFPGEARDVPSRHSSWGSGDTTRVVPSRNSSWGSYDIRAGGVVVTTTGGAAAGAQTDLTVDQNTSAAPPAPFGIFPYNMEDIPWNPGTVRRTKRRLEENSSHSSNMENSTNVIMGQVSTLCTVTTSPGVDSCQSRLSASAPEKSSMDLLATEENSNSLSRSACNIGSNVVVSTAKNFLEGLRRKDSSRRDVDLEEPNTNPGMVQSLKMEFEAKNNLDARVAQMNVTNSINSKLEQCSLERRSLPSSPLLPERVDEKPSSPTSDPGENVKELRGKFEKVSLKVSSTSLPHSLPATKATQLQPQHYNHSHRYSCVEVSIEKSPVRIKQTPLMITGFKLGLQEKSVESEFKRSTPVAPVVRHGSNMIPTSSPLPPVPIQISHNQRRHPQQQQQQYGKSHPLAQLGINKQRHNNAVYNTM